MRRPLGLAVDAAQPTPRAPRPGRRRRDWPRTAGSLLVAVVLLVSCVPETQSSDGAYGGRNPLAGVEVTPVPIQGTAPCSALSQNQQSVPAASSWTDLSLPCLTEESSVELASLGPRLTIVNLWASWCGPCREEMPLLEAAARDYAGGDEVQFVGVATRDAPEASARFLEEVDATFPQLVDVDGDLLAELGIPGLPATIALDGEGRVAQRIVGPVTADDIERLVSAAKRNS